MSSIAFAADPKCRSSQALGIASPVASQQPVVSDRNAILMEMGEHAAAQIKQASRCLQIPPRTVIRPLEDRAQLVLFPEGGLIAIQMLRAGGAASEVGTVGAEGAIGVLEALADAPSPFGYFSLAPTTAWGATAEILRRTLEAEPEARQAVWGYLARSQTALRNDVACATRHRGLERLADRLLAYREGLGERLPVTQDDLAQALGLTRTSVTALMTSLSNTGLTQTGRGWIKILAPDRLAKLACGCRRRARAASPVV